MKISIGIMGSADDALPERISEPLRQKAEQLGCSIADRDAVLLTGATTGLVHIAAKAAHEAGAFHIGVSPASHKNEHQENYGLPTDACSAIIYTGFGLKGRNVVLVRSCEIVLFLGGSIGALNEFTIAYDEGKVIGCLTGTGGVADEAARLIKTFPKETRARVFHNPDSSQLIEQCLTALCRIRPK